MEHIEELEEYHGSLSEKRYTFMSYLPLKSAILVGFEKVPPQWQTLYLFFWECNMSMYVQ